MTSPTILATAAALAMALTVPTAIAQTPTPPPKLVLADHAMRASMLIGMKVLDDQGQPLGTIVEILVKDQAVEPTAIIAVADLGALATKLVAVPLSHVKIKGDKATMPGTTMKMMIAMPLYDYMAGGGGR